MWKMSVIFDPLTGQFIDLGSAGAPDATNLLDVKVSCRFATTVNIADLAAGAPNSVDGGTPVVGDRILVKDQTTGSENGIYVVDVVGTGSDGAWSRATDFDDDSEVKANVFTFVQEGTVHEDQGWVVTTDGVITVGTDAITWAQFSGAGVSGDMLATNNLSDLTNIPTARVNLGLDTISQAEAEAGTGTTTRAFTAERVAQAISALAGSSSDTTALQTNLALNFFLDAIDQARSVQNLQDGYVDQFEDQTGVDDTNSVNESYDASGDFYKPTSSGADANTLLMLHSNTTDGSTVMTDSSASGLTLTARGNAQHDTAEKKFGASSILFDGTEDVVSIDDNATLEAMLDGSDFTIECWFNTVDTAVDKILIIKERPTTGIVLAVTHENGNLKVRMDDTPDNTFEVNILTTGLTLNDGAWHHVALVRNGTTVTIYIDGTAWGTTGTFSGALYNSTGPWSIGGLYGSDGIVYTGLTGWIDEIRFSDIARYTTNFTPATSAFGTIENMTLIAEPVVALSAPSTIHTTLFKEDVDAVTLNTDLMVWVSRSKRAFTATNATNLLNDTAHPYANDMRLILTSSAADLPLGLDSEPVYFVINANVNDYQVALTSGGAAVTFSDDGTGTHQAHVVTQTTLANEGTYSTYDIIQGTSDVSGQPSDTDVTLFVKSANNKDFKLHGQAVQFN